MTHWLSQGANIPSIEQIVIVGLSTFIQVRATCLKHFVFKNIFGPTPSQGSVKCHLGSRRS